MKKGAGFGPLLFWRTIEMRKALLIAALLAVPMNDAQAASFTFHCVLQDDLTVTYDNTTQTAVVETQNTAFKLPLAQSGSGARYSDGTTTFWEHQGEATFETPGASFAGCKR